MSWIRDKWLLNVSPCPELAHERRQRLQSLGGDVKRRGVEESHGAGPRASTSGGSTCLFAPSVPVYTRCILLPGLTLVPVVSQREYLLARSSSGIPASAHLW
jgi:hypothetical protein